MAGLIFKTTTIRLPVKFELELDEGRFIALTIMMTLADLPLAAECGRASVEVPGADLVQR